MVKDKWVSILPRITRAETKRQRELDEEDDWLIEEISEDEEGSDKTMNEEGRSEDATRREAIGYE